LFLLEPFGDIKHGFTLTGTLRIFSYALTASSVFFLAETFLRPKWQYQAMNKITKIILWYVLDLVLITVGIFFCRSLWLGIREFNFSGLTTTFLRVFSIGIIPAFLVLLYLFQSKRQHDKDEKVKLMSQDKNPEYLTKHSNEVHYLKSAENYTEVYFGHSMLLYKKLLRGSLIHFENQLPNNFLRVNRSVIINTDKVTEVKFDSKGGRVSLEHVIEPFKVGKIYAYQLKNKL